jgi:hypothetical protein
MDLAHVEVADAGLRFHWRVLFYWNGHRPQGGEACLLTCTERQWRSKYEQVTVSAAGLANGKRRIGHQ